MMTMNAMRFAGCRVASRAIARNSVVSNGGVSQTAFRAFASKVTGIQPVVDPTAMDQLGSVDHMYEEDRVDKVADPERRAFTYLMLSSVRFAYASSARLFVVKFIGSMTASADVLALAFAEFDLSNLSVGKTITVKWRGKPVFVRHRPQEEIDIEAAVPMSILRDQETDEERAIKPEYIVVIGICPHLGCVPVGNAGDYGGWFCPCHGSHYDTSGRIRKGPSPLNLEVPPYKFIDEKVILIG